MNEAVVLVAQSLELEFGRIMELLPGSKTLLLRAGVGWKEGCVGCSFEVDHIGGDLLEIANRYGLTPPG